MSSFGGLSGKGFRVLSFTFVVVVAFFLLEGEASVGVNSKRNNNDSIKFSRFEVYDLPAIQWACEPFLEPRHNMESKQHRNHLDPMQQKTRELCLKLRGGQLGDDAVVINDSSTEESGNSSLDGSSISVLENGEKDEAETDAIENESSSLPSSPIADEESSNATDEEEQANNIEPSASPSLANTEYRFEVFQKGDGHETDPDGIPSRYMKMQGNQRDLAKAALENTLSWRKENEVDTILARPHPKYDVSKAVFPHYFCGRDDTQHVILLQRPGLLNTKLAHKNGLSGEELLFHYIYVMEYLWRIVDPEPEATMTSIIDLTEMNMSILRKREQLRIGSLFLSTMDAHFPQRSHRTFLINAPKWFGTLYRIASPLLRESTKEKIMILSKGKEQDEVLRDLLRDCPIPEGAKYENVPAGIMEEELRNFCLDRLEESGEEMQPVATD